MKKKLTAKDFHPDLLELYDFYAHGQITKREFLDKAKKYAIGGMTALTLFNLMQPNYAYAQQVNFNDPEIDANFIFYNSKNGHGKIKAYQVGPKSKAPKGAVLVVHENRGLNPYIQDVARRLAKDGFLALAPDGLTPKGGYPGNDAKGKVLQKELDTVKLMNDFFAAFEFLHGAKHGSGKVGAVGFCYGGGVCNALAVAYPEMAASVPFYGRQAKSDDVPKIKAPLLIHYAENDSRINQGWPEYEKALKQHKKEFNAYIYPKTNHGFHNDSTPRYDEAAAKLAWSRTIEFFNKKLS